MSPVNPRKKKLDAICTKIAMFFIAETYQDEGDAQALLTAAIDTIERAATILVANDNKENAKDAE